MSAKSKNSDAVSVFGFIIFAALVIIYFLFAFAVPVLLLIGTIFYAYKVKNELEITLSADEISELAGVEKILTEARTRLYFIHEEGKQLKKNIDNSYHRGSKLGMRLNEELDELGPINESAGQQYRSLCSRPRERLKKLIHARCMAEACKVSLVVYIFAAIVLRLWKPKFLSFFALGDATNLELGAFVASGVLGCLACLSLYGVAYAKSKNYYEKQIENCESLSDDDEDRLNLKIASALVGDNTYEETGSLDVVETEDEPWFSVLGVGDRASREEINAAWREKMKKNHPDRVADLDEEFQQLAERRAKRLNQAREEGLLVAG